MAKTGTEPAVLETPFHPRTAALCRTNEWARWAGYTTVNCYDHVDLEYFAIRNMATLFDLSPMIKYRITGPDAEDYLNHLVTRDVRKIRPGRVSYVVWCNDQGQVLDDGTLFHLDDGSYRLCCQEHQLVWLTRSKIGFDVSVEDVTEEFAGLALQGPTSCAVLKAMGLPGIEDLRPFGIAQYDFHDSPLQISRTGFTGDLGYELWIEAEFALPLWDTLVAAGKDFGIRPVGSAALDLVRIEAGFIATNADFMAADQVLRRNRGRSPFELGLDWLVDFGKGHFTGRRALKVEQNSKSSRYCLVGFDIEGNKAAVGALVYHRKRKEVGHITSAMWSPTCKKNLALASLVRPYGTDVTDDLWVDIYVDKEMKWARQMCRARIVERPFFRHPRRGAVPALDF